MMWTSLLMMMSSLICLTNYSLEKTIMLEIEIHSSNSLLYFLSWVLDYYSMMFSTFVLLISAMIFMFGQYYMNSSLYQKQFNTMLSLFVLSMVLLIFSPNLMMLMIGWDGLGVVSFLLILFFKNSSSNNAGMLTFMINRLGDMFFISSIVIMWSFSSWNYEQMKTSNVFLMGLILIAGITKSAQVPFSSWLPNAMAAPTPVSALVHSSTLVTAGIFIFLRFYSIIKPILLLLFMLSMLTLLMSGLMANLEWDAKKMIAFSTLSQLGLMMSALSLNMTCYCFFHLITHALFKSALFMLVGINIHNFNNNQEMRNSSSMVKMSSFSMTLFLLCLMALSSFPFTSGFFSKDLIIDTTNLNKMLFFLYLLSIFLTILYSMRFCYLNLWNLNLTRQSSLMFYSNSLFLIMPMWVLPISGLLMGYLMYNLMHDIFMMMTNKMWKFMYFFMFSMFGLMTVLLNKPTKMMKKMFMMSNMWYLYYLSNQMIVNPMMKSLNKIFLSMDQGSMEMAGPQMIYNYTQHPFYIFKPSNLMLMINLFMVSIILLMF